jgi:SNF2 family DNA or RNA helicase
MTFSVRVELDRTGTLVNFQVEAESSESRPPEFNQWILASLEKPNFVNSSKFSISVFEFLSSLRQLAQMRDLAGSFQIVISDNRILSLIDEYKSLSLALEGYAQDLDKRITESQLKAALSAEQFKRTDELSTDQIRDITRMAYLKHAANFSVPGAGKTTALLAVHAFERAAGRVDSLLVIAPRNALGSWEIEVSKCFQTDSVTRLTGGRERVQKLLLNRQTIATISYQLMRNCVDILATYLARNKVHLVLDEAHRAKAGVRSQQGQSALELAPLAVRRDILTGTPMPQGISDIESQMSFLWPGQPVFDESRQLDDQVSQAKSSIKPLYVRTRKSELGLPEIQFYYHPIEMESWQRELHSVLVRRIVREISSMAVEDEVQLRKVGRQIMKNILFCADPRIFQQSLEGSAEYGELRLQIGKLISDDSAKLKFLDDLLVQILNSEGEKVVIWSSFTAVIEKLTSRYSNYGASFIHGGVATSEESVEGSREWVIEQFHTNDRNRVLVANPAACGEGISLHHAAHNAIYFDRSFNAAHYLQSIDRIHRRGLPEGVETNVHVLFLEETIEEVIRDRLSSKVKSLEVLLEDPDLVRMVYDPEDLVDYGLDDSGLDATDVRHIAAFLGSVER